MRKVISLALLLCSIFTTLWAQSHAYKVEEIPMVHLQNRTRYVSNPDGILSAGAVAAMDTTLCFGATDWCSNASRSRKANRRR